MTTVAAARQEDAVPETPQGGMFRRLALRRAASEDVAPEPQQPQTQQTVGGLPVRGHTVAPTAHVEGSSASLTGVELYQALTGQDWLASSDEQAAAPWSAQPAAPRPPAAAAPVAPAPALPQQAPARPSWLPPSGPPAGLPLWSQGLQQPRTLDPRSVQAPPPPPAAPVAPPLPVVQPGSATVAVPALSSNVRPALILKEQAARDLLAAAKAHDVGRGGVFAAGPAGVQVWSQPFDGPGGTHGSSVHLGSIDWIYDTPAKNYATIYRAMTTSAGISVGHTPETILSAVLALTGLSAEGSHLTMPAPPPRDPFRRRIG